MHSNDPYQDLANAIVLQAARDYRTALKILKRNPRNESAAFEVDEDERFFRSPWFGVLTEVDGEYLIERMREEAGI
jgi:hypothetical protein